jgi:hypothetical protein
LTEIYRQQNALVCTCTSEFTSGLREIEKHFIDSSQIISWAKATCAETGNHFIDSTQTIYWKKLGNISLPWFCKAMPCSTWSHVLSCVLLQDAWWHKKIEYPFMNENYFSEYRLHHAWMCELLLMSL